MIGILLLAVFFVLLFLGIPISVGMGISTAVSMIVGHYNLAQIPILLQKGISNTTLIAIIYFVLAANIMNTGGITRRIFDFAEACVGWMKGGLAQVNVISSVIFSGISGTSSADAAGLGLMEITAMEEKGYDKGWSTGITLASGLLGPIIPPSVAFIQYALFAEVSATDMFLAGIIPGVLITIVLMIINRVIAGKGESMCPAPQPFDGKKLLKATKDGFLALLAPVVLMVCIFSGKVTANESGIIAVLYSLLASALYRELSWKNVKKALYDTVISSAVIMFLIGFGSSIGWILTIERVAQMLTTFMMSLSSSKFVILILINILLLILGMFMDTTTVRVITVPLLLPLIDLLGISRIQFGVIHTLNCLIGTCTPPVGVGLSIISTVTNQKFSDVVKAMIRFFPPLIFALVLVTYIPVVSTWLPSLVR